MKNAFLYAGLSLLLLLFTTSILIELDWMDYYRNENLRIFMKIIIDENTEAQNILSSYSERNCGFMTLGHDGRTGNNMFQYAAFYGLAKKNNKIPFIGDPNFPLFKAFKLTTPFLNMSAFNTSTFIRVPNWGFFKFNESLFNLPCKQNYSMHGKRQSWKYFQMYSTEIKREFEFVDEISFECDRVLNEITTKRNISRSECILVGAHVRRGDFISKESWGFVQPTKEYLHKAVNFFDTRHYNRSCIAFLVIGEDYKWNLENSPNRTNVIVLKPNANFLDMCILSRCNHTIMSSGTFGWWSAYLAGGEVAYISNQYRPNSSLHNEYIHDDYINPDWKWFPL